MTESSIFSGKFIVVGVCGGIAAYKSVELIRYLVDAGAHVATIMTPDAEHFIGKTTLTALSSEPVHTSLWDDQSVIPHTRLGQKADLIVVAPSTARLIGSYAAGISSDLLTATLIATRAPVVVCPAMHTEMWEHVAVQHNISVLRSRGVFITPPEEGRLAGGDVGKGRLASTHSIVEVMTQALQPQMGNGSLSGKHVVVTAGGTREPIDAVRVLANRSSGKQGHAVARAAASRGALVTLITTVEMLPASGIIQVQVETAQQMQEAIEKIAPSADVIVMAAAVADFRPVSIADGKWKKEDGVPPIVLEATPDILAGLGKMKRPGQVLVGFAAETSNLVANAQGKLERKNLDLIVANDVSLPEVGFGHETNAVTIVSAYDEPVTVDLASKTTIAQRVLDSVEKSLHRIQEHT